MIRPKVTDIERIKDEFFVLPIFDCVIMDVIQYFEWWMTA